MSLLMPEYERQLRAATRRLASEQTPASAHRRRLRSTLLIATTAAVAVAVAAITLILLHSSDSTRTAAQPLPALQYDCGAGETLPARGPLAPIAHGTVAGMAWTLEADGARHGLASVQAGQLLIDGHAYGFCRSRLNVQLINTGAHGVVYGLIARPYRPPFRVEAASGHGTAVHSIRAGDGRVRVMRVRGAYLVVGWLPQSACAYHSLVMTASQATGGNLVGAVSIYRAACAPAQLRPSRPVKAPAPTWP